MKLRKERLQLALLIGLLLAPGAAFGQISRLFVCPGPSVHFEAEVLLLNRTDHFTDRPVVQNRGGATLISTNDVEDYNLGVGPRLALAFPICDGVVWEASWFGAQHWRGDASVESENLLRIPGDLGLRTQDFLDADAMHVSYASELNNFEMNQIQQLGNLQLLGGFRYVNLDDSFNIHAVDSDTGESDYRVHSWNNLFGAQVGARYEDFLWCLEWSFEGKIGLFGNAASERNLLQDSDNGVVIRDAFGDRRGAALVGDLNLSMVHRFGPHWAARGGYNVMWMEGLALAPDQLDFTNTAISGTRVDAHGDMFLHGANVGLEAQW